MLLMCTWTAPGGGFGGGVAGVSSHRNHYIVSLHVVFSILLERYIPQLWPTLVFAFLFAAAMPASTSAGILLAKTIN